MVILASLKIMAKGGIIGFPLPSLLWKVRVNLNVLILLP